MTSDHQFPHEKLEAYRVCDQLIAALAPLIAGMPKGESKIADQLRRAGDSVMLNLCEGASRFAARDKAHFFDIAVASGSECAGALQIMLRRELADPTAIESAKSLTRRVTGLLVGLAKSVRRRIA